MPGEAASLFLGAGLSMRLLDGCACALLAAAASCRSRNMGAHVSGAIVLGCLCGLIGPLLREAFVHGSEGTVYIATQFPAEALIGAAAGVAGAWIARHRPGGLFYWLDASGIALASSVGSLLALPETGIVGAVAIGLINGLGPGLVRDISLGDTALLVEQDWYATAAAMGCLCAIGVLVWLAVGWISDWTATHADETAALSGCVLVMAIRAWRRKK